VDISGFDGFEHSMILQIMPYGDVEVINDVNVPEWVEHWTDYKVFHEVGDNSKAMELPTKVNTAEKTVFVTELEMESDSDLEYVNTKKL
jgi:hypothetical protein